MLQPMTRAEVEKILNGLLEHCPADKREVLAGIDPVKLHSVFALDTELSVSEFAALWQTITAPDMGKYCDGCDRTVRRDEVVNMSPYGIEGLFCRACRGEAPSDACKCQKDRKGRVCEPCMPDCMVCQKEAYHAAQTEAAC